MNRKKKVGNNYSFHDEGNLSTQSQRICDKTCALDVFTGNHRIIWVARDLKDDLVPTPCPPADRNWTQGCTNWNLDQGGR